jgi:sRNA-binding carbon storage regulator CsrA
MLVLTVELGERVRLWADNDQWLGTVKVTNVGGSWVQLGFQAPETVSIWREKIDRHDSPAGEQID